MTGTGSLQYRTLFFSGSKVLEMANEINVRRNQIKLTVNIEEYTQKCESQVRYIYKYVK